MRCFVSIALIFIYATTRGQQLPIGAKASDFVFGSIFGQYKDDDKRVYCLLGSGFFKNPRSENADSLIAKWFKDHADAVMIPVSSIPNAGRGQVLTYCWFQDKNNTINEYLIRNGCYPGSTMLQMPTRSEMSKEEKKIYGDLKITTHVDKKAYNAFVERIKSAEILAHENKLGVWKDD